MLNDIMKCCDFQLLSFSGPFIFGSLLFCFLDYNPGLAVSYGSSHGLHSFALVSLILVTDGEVKFIMYADVVKVVHLHVIGSY